jgi:hypothetical protein
LLTKKNRFPLSEPFNFNTGRNVSIRLYPDSRPHTLEVAPLQKGLLLVANEKELIGEGVGFGVPVVKYADKTFFSSTAETSMHEDDVHYAITKSFFLDTISKKRFENGPFISDRTYKLVHSSFEKAYLALKNFRPAFDKIMELRNTLKIRTQFVKVEPRGRVDVKYKFFPNYIKVELDIRNLNYRGIKEILVLNEQGSTFFRNYFDDEEQRLFNEQIGAWEQVKAERASFSDIKRTIVFTLKNINGAKLYRGWEQVKKRFCWAGLNYSLLPNVVDFDYPIVLG